MGESRMLIDGRLVDAEGGATFENVNPATEEVIATVQAAGKEDIDDAVAAEGHTASDLSAFSTADLAAIFAVGALLRDGVGRPCGALRQPPASRFARVVAHHPGASCGVE